jgi:hypothetical protein
MLLYVFIPCPLLSLSLTLFSLLFLCLLSSISLFLSYMSLPLLLPSPPSPLFFTFSSHLLLAFALCSLIFFLSLLSISLKMPVSSLGSLLHCIDMYNHLLIVTVCSRNTHMYNNAILPNAGWFQRKG